MTPPSRPQRPTRTATEAPVGTAPISVFVVDDHNLVREGIVGVISQRAEMAAVGSGTGDAETMRALTAASPRVLVVDLEMPSIRGPSFIAMARDALPQLRVVVCTMHASHGYVSDALGHGANAYVLKSSSAEVLIDAIRAVAAGRAFIDPALQDHVVRLVQTQMTRRGEQDLTALELQVLRFAADGLTNPEIAARIGQSVESVKLRLRWTFRKLGVRDRASAVAGAIRRGLI
jgi:DNA-binding NarL/FixJ family response regulator